MTPNIKTDPGYLDYHKYTNFKKYFEKAIKTNDTPDHWKESLDHVTNISNNSLPYKEEIFKILINYFSQYTLFSSNKASECCSYANFWLNNKIRESYGELPSTNFSLFNEFAKIYSKHKYNNNYQSCEPYLNYLDLGIYNKMKLLYDLYRMYDEINSPPSNTQFIACDTLSTIRKLYNDDIKNYFEHDSYLFNKLNHFKNLIKKLNLESISKCRLNLSLFEEPDEDKKRREEQLKMEAKMLTEERSSPEIRVETLDTSHNQLPPKVPEPPPIQEETNRAQTHREYDNHGGNSNNRAMYNYTTKIDVKTEMPPPLEPPRGRFVTLRTQLQPHHEENLQRQELSNEPARDSSTILGSITGFINDVEPAPILGVSGGMGALFLLFKYTPVGTFFRGGRRINNRIPRTFYGQFAGGPAGYDDFYKGGFGPGPINISYRPELE